MTLTIEDSSTADKFWNNRLILAQGTIFQTTQYFSFVKEAFDWKPKFIKFLDPKGEIIGQIALAIRPRFPKSSLKRILSKVPSFKSEVYQWVYGPVVLQDGFSKEICAEFYNYLRTKKCRVNGSEFPLNNNFLSCFKQPFQKVKWATSLIDLSKDLDEIWKQIDNHSGRKNIKRSQERGVVIKEINEKNLQYYYEILRKTKSDVNEEVEFSTVKILWEKLHPIGLEGFLAFYDDKPIGGIIISAFNNYINEWGVARSQIDRQNNLYSQDLLKWAIIKWGRETKKNYYDLSGVNPHPKNEKERGILRFKKKWGGKLYEYNRITS
ncbi:MAG: hypothetical protein ACRENO_04590 [Thermodesulfobacteriota bacterium]